jgi:hypothetical protein
VSAAPAPCTEGHVGPPQTARNDPTDRQRWQVGLGPAEPPSGDLLAGVLRSFFHDTLWRMPGVSPRAWQHCPRPHPLASFEISEFMYDGDGDTYGRNSGPLRSGASCLSCNRCSKPVGSSATAMPATERTFCAHHSEDTAARSSVPVASPPPMTAVSAHGASTAADVADAAAAADSNDSSL